MRASAVVKSDKTPTMQSKDHRSVCCSIEEKYLVIDSPQSLLGNIDLVCTSFKEANWGMIDFVFAGIEHSLLVEELLANPLQRYPLRWKVTGGSEVMAALDLKPETVLHVAGGVYEDTKVRVLVRAYPVRPVIFEGGAVVYQQLDKESTRRSCWGNCRSFGSLNAGRSLLGRWRWGRRRRSSTWLRGGEETHGT